MLLDLHRDILGKDATLGVLRVDFGKGVGLQDFGFVCEDESRGLRQDMTLAEIQQRKVKNETAIPAGDYTIRWTYSPKYAAQMREWSKAPGWRAPARKLLAQGFMPEVLGVPGFVGIRIHVGNDDDDTAGCLLPGLNRDLRTMTVASSRKAVVWLYNALADAGDTQLHIHE